MVGRRPVVNLRYLNEFIPYQHFKMEGLFCLRELLQEGDYMCKLDMIFQFHCISHQGIMFGFHGQGIFTSSSAYVSAWDQLPKSSQNC